MQELQVGKGRMIRDGEDVAILTIGHIGNYAVEACRWLAEEELSPAHFDMRFVKPLDEELLHSIFKRFKKIVTVEDGCLMGGFGSAVLEFMNEQNYQAQVVRLGIPDEYIEHGEQMELHTQMNYHPQGIAQAVKSLIEPSLISVK
jgi:1-deoxy-D-xylulose-5-phosphate synthase